MNDSTPKAEIDISTELVRTLLRSQHPDLAELRLEYFSEGWDNVIFRLGDGLLVRLPRRALGASLVESEQTWLPEIAKRVDVPLPLPVRLGIPSDGYPWKWSIVPRLPGNAVDTGSLGAGDVEEFANFLNALHEVAPGKAPENASRGVHLRKREVDFKARMKRIVDEPEHSDLLYSIWQEGIDSPPVTMACWIHGDLHPQNVLSDSGKLSGVIDWGDLTSGDVATDLASVWMLFDSAVDRAGIFQSYRWKDDYLYQRSRAWAVCFGLVLLDTGKINNPAHEAIGRMILQRVLD